ncbi:uncharacterized protein LOC128318950 isoform X2 [Pangasianodon hypophthalmus]|uniref:uncharacterized protein LOC128318950 isoform X2 n=1 Tax=Pangasianodon hypophthalmus TaxID=310915 RepID=UPI002307EE18|nr:uncharacterized protein LOC128318950 isoform X2 [Pangasianodon hypophthalmus]
MSSLSYICIIWFSSVGFLRADSQIISARVGSTAVLPCEWRNVSIQTPNVQWNTASEIVFERKGVQWYEGEGYKNRVDVPQDKLLKGNCSLVLKNVTLTDAGIYESFLSVKRTKRASSTRWILVQSVELSVNETPEENLQEISTARENFYHKLIATDAAGVNCPRPQIIHFSLLSCLLFLGFGVETSVW